MPFNISSFLAAHCLFCEMTSSLIAFFILENDIGSYRFRKFISIFLNNSVDLLFNGYQLFILRVCNILSSFNQILDKHTIFESKDYIDNFYSLNSFINTMRSLNQYFFNFIDQILFESESSTNLMFFSQ